MKKYVVEGLNIFNLNSLFKEFARAVNAPEGYFGRCLQSFDDCLFGGFGLESPCVIVWKNSNISKKYLDSEMLKKFYEDIYKDILENGEFITEEGLKYIMDTTESAKKGKKTMFDEITEFIKTVTERANYEWIIKLVLE